MYPFGRLFDSFLAAIVDRLASAALPARGNNRKLLAREMVALHRNLLMAAELCQSVVSRLTGGTPLGIDDDEWLHSVDWEAKRVSDELMQTIRRLKGALEVMDPPLAKALEVLYESKFSILMMADSSVHYDGHQLRIWEASEALCNLRLENLLRRLDGPDILVYVDWPYGAVEGGLGKGEPVYDEHLIGVEDDPGSQQRGAELAAHLEVHRLALLNATERVAGYVREKFDLSDIL